MITTLEIAHSTGSNSRNASNIATSVPTGFLPYYTLPSMPSNFIFAAFVANINNGLFLLSSIHETDTAVVVTITNHQIYRDLRLTIP